MGFGPLQRAVPLADFARVHGGAHLLLGMVVMRAHPLMVEKREQLAPVASQAFDQASGIGIVEGSGNDDFVKALDRS